MIRPRVLLADDNSSWVAAVTALLQPHFDVVGTASDGIAMVSEALRLHPAVIVVDVTMPLLNGIEAAHQLRASGSSSKLVFLSIHPEEEFINACLAEGASGYVLKSHMKAHLVPAIHAALAGARYFTSADRA